MQNVKRNIAGSVLALALTTIAATAAHALAAAAPVLVYCISCGAHHLIEI